VSAGSGTSATPSRGWIIPALRAVSALVVGFAITFTPAHSAEFGLIAFGIFAVVAGAILLAGSIGAAWITGGDLAARGLFTVQGIVTVVAGIAALALPVGGTSYLVFVVSAWAIVSGALELVSGIRARTRLPAARDWMFIGGLTLLLAIGFLIVPPGYNQTLGGIEQIKGQLTASVILVGMFGAWAIVAGVLLGIASVSARDRRTMTSAAGSSDAKVVGP
jgi:uncharacterized membrane protein HdeD (DUF308 family)